MPEEFEQGGNQTIETIESTETPIQQEPAQIEPQQEPQSQPQENAFTVKYNKEEMQIPYEQAPDYIQKGLNYDKVSQRAETYQQQLDRIAQLSGYQSQDEMLSALNEIEQERERQKYEQAGIDPDQFKQLVSELPEIQQFRQIQQQQEEQQRLQTEANELFGEFPDLTPEQIPQEAWQLKESKGISLLDAYLRTSYKSLGQQKEQEAIQKLQNNAISSPGSLGGGNVDHNQSISQMSKADFDALQQRVLRGENVQF